LNEKTLRDVSQAIAAHIEPRIYPEITQQNVAEKSCLHIRANGQQKPYFAYGRAYIRVADEDRQMSTRELKSLILHQNRIALRWDNEPAATVTLQALNEHKIRRFVETAGLPWDNAHNALEKLDLLHEGQPVNAARLFFADESIQLRCAVFASHTSSTIIDRHDFNGDILELIEEAEKYILKNIRIGMRLDGLRRIDVPEISREALREAIINAFCHRDWRDPDYIQIAIYKDRVEIRNPGLLYDNLTLADLRRGNISRRRNPLVADLLRRIHLVEAWGRGMSLILENAPNVTFSEVAGLFIASFQRPAALDVTPKSRSDSAENYPDSAENYPDNAESYPDNTRKTPRKERQENIQKMLLQLLRQEPRIASSALAKASGMSVEGVKYHLALLKRTGKLCRHGSAKGGHWEVID
jgi:ATP-dependent DNA helicase RecG